jgi:hypothetical protein
VTGGKPIAVLLQSISGVSAINPLIAFYDIHGGKREVLFFYFVPDTTREILVLNIMYYLNKLQYTLLSYFRYEGTSYSLRLITVKFDKQGFTLLLQQLYIIVYFISLIKKCFSSL